MGGRGSDWLAWELSIKMQISTAVKLTFCQGAKNACGEKKVRCLKKKGNNGFNSALNTYETPGVHSHMAVAQLSHLNCEHGGWLWLSQAGISTERRYSYMFLFIY